MPETIPAEPQPIRVSVLLVGYNQAKALRRAIAALLQSTERLEILVIDCASVDDSTHLDREFPGLQLLRLPHHLGATRAMNIGLRTLKAEMVMFASPNLEVQPGTIKALADRLESDTSLAAAAPLLVNAEGYPVPQLRGLPPPAALARGAGFDAQPVDLGAGPKTMEFPSLDALLIRKNFVRGMNYFDERFGHTWADADLAMQIRRAGKKAVLFPDIHAAWHAAEDPLEGDPIAKADRIAGAAAFLGKYAGGGAAFVFRMKAAFSALGHFDFSGLSGVLSGKKLDGSQAH